MKVLLFILATYALLLNLVTSYRLYHDDLYERWQKWIQCVLIWLLPLIGSIFVSIMLNRGASSQKKFPRYLVWLEGVFFLNNNSTQGYPSSANEYGDYTGGVEPGSHTADGGGFGGE